MKRKLNKGQQNPCTASSYAPIRAIRLLNMLEAGLTKSHGRKLTLAEVAGYAGLSTSTMFDWLTWSRLQQIECVIRLFEALPKRERKRVVKDICRTLPAIRSKRVAWAEAQASGLEFLLRKENGLTLVQGDESSKGFLVTALGHSGARLGPPFRRVSGIDLRYPTAFVPVPGVIYLNQPLPTKELREYAETAWRLIKGESGQIVLLNGVWVAAPHLREEIKAASFSNHVIVADAFDVLTPQMVKSYSPTAHIVTSTDLGKRRLKVDIQSI